jgi:uncharacterized membrane protein YdjX (TVP38/TMEM64 family)
MNFELPSEHRKRFGWLILGVLVIVLLAIADVVHGPLQQGIELAEGWIRRHPVWGAVGFVVVSMVAAMVAFFSSAVLVPSAVLAWGEGWTIVLLWVGWFLGGVTSYGIGKVFGHRVVGWMISRERLDRYSGVITEKAGFGRVLLFQLALPSEIPGYVLGTLRYRFAIYAAALAVAEIPFAFGAVLLGKSFLDRNFIAILSIGAAGLLLMLLAVWLWSRTRNSSSVHDS